MKILFLITGLGVGGAERVVCNLADALFDLGHEVKIAYLLSPALVKPKNDAIELELIGSRRVSSFFSSYIKLRKIIKKFRPDVVHTHMFHPNILARLVRLTTRIPKLISTAHNTYEGGKLRMLAYRYTDFLTDITTNVSEEAVIQFVKKKAVPKDKIISIPNGIDTDFFRYSDKGREKKREELELLNKKMLLAVGRLDVQKDYPNLLNAIVSLKEKRRDFKLFIVGDGPLREQLKELVIDLDLENFVSFLGVRRDIPDLMSATDVFVLSSAWEGFGLVVGEAMSCERVVVATDCGGVKEVVGDCGFLVEVNNSYQLADSIDYALNISMSKREELGVAARSRILNNYSLIANTQKYMGLYL